MMKVNLSVYSVYFDNINRGIKTTEYRDLTPYYVDKFVDKSHYEGKTSEEIVEILRKGGKLYPLPIEAITFHNNGRVLTMSVKEIKTYDHNTIFAIKLGKRIND